MFKLIYASVLLTFLCAGILPALPSSYEKAWTMLLQNNVSSGSIDGVPLNLVDYDNLQNNAEFRRVVQSIEQTDPAQLGDKNAKMAFWINVYNIAAINMILDNQPVESIRDIGSLFSPVWDKDAITINGTTYSLGHIEHEILRPMGDARIHFAIVCASVSCPDLRPESYSADKLDAQLDEQTRKFLQNEVKSLALDRDKQVVHISSIFKWFKEDFDGEQGILTFLSQYSDTDVSGYKIKYLPYNWNLNSK